MRSSVAWVTKHRLALAAWVAIAVWGVLVARFRHPAYGFTRFLQYDASAESCAISEIRAQPVFVYRDTGGYDGHYYAQIAFHPDLQSPEFPVAIDNLRYRARRILGSALAWTISLGEPRRVPHVYATINLVAWLALAWVLWRLLPVRDARSWCAWAGVMFSAGAMFSVRLALTDLLALLGVALAWLQLERAKPARGVAWLATAALARETSLAAIVGWWDELRLQPRSWLRPAWQGLLALAPLAVWIGYTYYAAPIGDQGTDNLGWPLVGWVGKVRQLWRIWPGDAGWWLTFTTVLAFVGFTAQALWFLIHPQPRDRVWRLGAIYTVLFTLLGYAVWEGNPGAATRVLLPLTLAFALAAVRTRMPWAWFVVGMLPVVAGLESMRLVFHDARELAAGNAGGAVYVVRTGGDFHPIERSRRDRWAWSAGHGELEVRAWSHADEPVALRLELRTLNAGTTRIRIGEQVLWQGATGPAWSPVQFAAPLQGGLRVLSVETDAPPQAEGFGANSRQLALAIRRVTVGGNVTAR